MSEQTTQTNASGADATESYKLRLDHNDIFPKWSHGLPLENPYPGEKWYIITEIKSVLPSVQGRPTYQVEDRCPGNFYTVVFYIPYPFLAMRDCKPGRVLCIKDVKLDIILEGDGSTGFRVEDQNGFFVLPCTLKKLRDVHLNLKKRNAAGLFTKCIACNESTVNRCIKCKSRYCCKDCQVKDWKMHKPVCEVLETLLKWNVTDWGINSF